MFTEQIMTKRELQLTLEQHRFELVVGPRMGSFFNKHVLQGTGAVVGLNLWMENHG